MSAKSLFRYESCGQACICEFAKRYGIENIMWARAEAVHRAGQGHSNESCHLILGMVFRAYVVSWLYRLGRKLCRAVATRLCGTGLSLAEVKIEITAAYSAA